MGNTNIMRNFFIGIFLISPVLSYRQNAWNELEAVLDAPNIRNKFLSLTDIDSQSRCTSDLKKFIQNVGKEDWANRMFDSMEKIPYGFLYGRFHYIGLFDECLSARSEVFKGQHCMVNIYLGEENPDETMMTGPFKLSYGLCLPSTCTANDVQQIIDRLGIPKNITVRVEKENCWTDDPIVLSYEDWIVICFLGTFALIAISSTIFDVMQRRNRTDWKRYELYSSFSLYKNYETLTNISTGPGNIGCLHGVRALTMCWIILGHEYYIALVSPRLNGIIVPQFIKSKSNLLITNALVSVDTFFLLSGFFVSMVFFREISKKKYYDGPVATIHRYIRLTPAYAVMVLIQSTIILQLGRGPVWSEQVKPGVDMCRENWWCGLIYLQNVIAPTCSCLGQSWYLSSDMQMFGMAPLLLFPLLLWRKKGIVIYFLGLAAALTINFAVSFAYSLGPHLLFKRSMDQVKIDYMQSHMRMVPYIIGIGTAYIICGIKSNKITVNLSKHWITIGWLSSIGLCLGSIYGLAFFIDHGFEDRQLESSLYLTFHRLGWSLGIAWVIFACIVGYGGPVNTILSWEGFQFFGKLSYSMFLVHFTVQTCRMGLTQTNYYVDNFNIVTNFFSTFVYSLFFSIPLYLCFELPFINLDRYFLSKIRLLPFPRPKPEPETDSSPPKVETAT